MISLVCPDLAFRGSPGLFRHRSRIRRDAEEARVVTWILTVSLLGHPERLMIVAHPIGPRSWSISAGPAKRPRLTRLSTVAGSSQAELGPAFMRWHPPDGRGLVDMVEPMLNTSRRTAEPGHDGSASGEAPDDRPTSRVPRAVQVVDLLNVGWLPPASWLQQFTGADQPGRPSVQEDRAVIRATARRVRAEDDELHLRSEQARERARELLAAAERLVTRAVDQDREDADPVDSAGLDEWSADTHAWLEARTDIYRAVGMVMLHHRCNKAEAWTVLTGTSQRANRKVRDIAAALIEHVAAGHGYPDDLAQLVQTGLDKPCP